MRQRWSPWVRRQRVRQVRQRALTVEPLEQRTLLSFTQGPLYDVGPGPSSVVAADLNGDYVPDLAVAERGSDTVRVLLGYGDGSFLDLAAFVAGPQPDALVASDFNFDGWTDLAAITQNRYATVLLGAGYGYFWNVGSFDLLGRAVALRVGDFTGDYLPDLVSANTFDNTVTLLRGNGDGTFQPARTFASPSVPQDIAAGDFNGDGALDVATANSNSATVGILLGNGNGTFQPVRQLNLGIRAVFLAAGDLNFDGLTDLVTSNNMPIHTVSVLLSNGDGTFLDTWAYPIQEIAFALTVADMNADYVPDIVTMSYNMVSAVLLGYGNGWFVPAQNFFLPYAEGRVTSLAVEDFNFDGYLDVAFPSATDDKLAIALNAGNWGAGPGGAPGSFVGERTPVPPSVGRTPLRMSDQGAVQPLAQPPTTVSAARFAVVNRPGSHGETVWYVVPSWGDWWWQDRGEELGLPAAE